jgi:hypothetical protein
MEIHGKTPFLMDKSTISMASFNSKPLVITREYYLLLQASGWKSHPLGPRLFESFVAQRHEALASAADADGAGNWRWDILLLEYM